MTEPTISLSGVRKTYGAAEAVKDIAFSVGEGEIVALVGHNGAGKTTLIKLMLGLIWPTDGAVRMLGSDPKHFDPGIRQRIGYLPESVAFHMALTGRETLNFYAKLKNTDIGKLDGLFERVGLETAAADRPVRTYSKGMRQRLGLAQALLGRPRVLLLDEPTSGLDPALRRSFYNLIERLRSEGTSILLSSHALTELEQRTERVIILNKGRKIADGSLDTLRSLAELPTRIRITVADGNAQTPSGAEWRSVGQNVFETSVGHREKLRLIRAISTGREIVTDMHITEPTLDDLYAHFLSLPEAAHA